MVQVFRCYTEKRDGFQVEAGKLLQDLKEQLGIKGLTGLRIFCRYDAQGLTREIYDKARVTVFSEPMVDDCYDEELPPLGQCRVLAVESLPGQYDQRADSCAQCIGILSCGERPLVSAAKVYVLYGDLSEEDMDKIRGYVINPVECREASLEKPATLEQTYGIPTEVATLEGFIDTPKDQLSPILEQYGLAMDLDDLSFFQDYFRNEAKRDPTVTELKVVDTYWSDHCRHTTFSTHIDSSEILDEEVRKAYELYLSCREEVYGERAKTRPITLMDMGTLAAKTLKKRGILKNLDESEEINACSVHVDADMDGQTEDWLLMFKNETHNQPTEIEPFGGAATCVGGAIRDPLSGRSYVYQAMRVTGAGDPTVPLSETIPGKLPQRKLTTTAAAGYSSYGNQIGLSTGLVHEFYHPGYVAKRLEIGAVVGAAPASNVVREVPAPGDRVILLGGRTGRDGCGGATGSSKSHTSASLETCSAEVQKGNAPEERKLQRLFRDPTVTRLIKRCNDFGAGGVSVAIGELADGLDIDLNAVPKKYDGLDGTELAISESQERMAVVVAPEHVAEFMAAAARENLEATLVASVTEEPRMVLRWNGKSIVDLSREFLASNGADKHTTVQVPKLPTPVSEIPEGTPSEKLRKLVAGLDCCSQRGLVERFDGSIGAASVLMPFGGKNQTSPTQVMAALLPSGVKDTSTCSVMSFGFNPAISSQSPFAGAAGAVVESVSKLVAAGCDPDKVYLTFQEYFERLRTEPARWGKPFAALLGAFTAQIGLGVAAIGGKDSMSGSFNELDVPPTLVSFAIAPQNAEKVLSPEFKAAGHPVYLFEVPGYHDYDATKAAFRQIHQLSEERKILSAWSLTAGGAAEGIFKMSMGNEIGFLIAEDFSPEKLFAQSYGSILAEACEPIPGAVLVGYTTDEAVIDLGDEPVAISEYQKLWEDKLESVFPVKAGDAVSAPAVLYNQRMDKAPAYKHLKPKAVIPVFPGTNCEYDTARAVAKSGGEPEILVVRNLTASALQESVDAMEKAIREAQMIILPGGFSGGDEPDGSGKFIASFFRNPVLMDAVHDLLKQRDGLMLGICNGFQALIKLGLVPFGEIVPMDKECPTLTYNLIGRHQSRYSTTRVASVKSPWLMHCQVGDLHNVPFSHGEGRFVATEEMLRQLVENGQVAFQYTDLLGNPSMDIRYNPNGSMMAIEGITSPDGRVLGKMGHTERAGALVGKNIYGEKYQPIFQAGVDYFK
ncbi:MAG: phosphoribosylformylglycinamidine synthase [Oscillospiraceae bacterium]|nr:phosphoribosylformylglycinamidine synthase [Oscillospiraceae bacterium]